MPLVANLSLAFTDSFISGQPLLEAGPGVLGHLSILSGTPSPSVSGSLFACTIGHPFTSTGVLIGVLAHLSRESGTPSPSESGSAFIFWEL